MNECDHEWGYYYISYEGWWPIEYEMDIDMAKSQEDFTLFRYCPHCGEEIRGPE